MHKHDSEWWRMVLKLVVPVEEETAVAPLSTKYHCSKASQCAQRRLTCYRQGTVLTLIFPSAVFPAVSSPRFSSPGFLNLFADQSPIKGNFFPLLSNNRASRAQSQAPFLLQSWRVEKLRRRGRMNPGTSFQVCMHLGAAVCAGLAGLQAEVGFLRHLSLSCQLKSSRATGMSEPRLQE